MYAMFVSFVGIGSSGSMHSLQWPLQCKCRIGFLHVLLNTALRFITTFTGWIGIEPMYEMCANGARRCHSSSYSLSRSPYLPIASSARTLRAVSVATPTCLCQNGWSQPADEWTAPHQQKLSSVKGRRCNIPLINKSSSTSTSHGRTNDQCHVKESGPM